MKKYLRVFGSAQERDAAYASDYYRPWVAAVEGQSGVTWNKPYIKFVDPEVRRICVENFSSDGDVVTYEDAAAVTNNQLGYLFSGNTLITSFNELKYFTSVTQLAGDNNDRHGAFAGCSQLTGITIPPNVTALMHYAIYDCPLLEEVTMFRAVNAGYNGNFESCPSLVRFNIPSSLDWYNTSWRNRNGFNSSTNGGRLYDNRGVELTHMQVPDGVTTVKPAYYKCIGITGVTFPSSVTTVSNETFEGCTSLMALYIGGKMNLGNVQAFRGCSNLKHMYFSSLPNLLESSWYANAMTGYRHPFDASTDGHIYVDNQELTSIVVPSTVTKIEDKAVKNCKQVTSVTFHNAVTKIGVQAFYCVPLTGLSLPSSLTTIGISAFDGCSGITGTVVIPSGVTMGEFIFRDCTNITNLVSYSTLNCANGANRIIKNCGNKTGIIYIDGDYVENGNNEMWWRFAHIIITGNLIRNNDSLPRYTMGGDCVKSIRIGGNVDYSLGYAIRCDSNQYTTEFVEVMGTITIDQYLIKLGSKSPHIDIHLGYSGIACSPSKLSDLFTTIDKVYVGDGSSQSADQAVLNTYLADTDWQVYSNKLATWWSYNGEYKTMPAIPTS